MISSSEVHNVAPLPLLWTKFVVRPWVCHCMTVLTQKECPSFESPLFELILVPGSWDLSRLGMLPPPPPLGGLFSPKHVHFPVITKRRSFKWTSFLLRVID